MASQTVSGRLVLADRIAGGRILVEDGFIASVEPDEGDGKGPYIAPGFIDVHVHGWGGHQAMGSTDDLEGMAARLLRHGVTAFLPTAVTAPLEALVAFSARIRKWIPQAPAGGAAPLGFNLEGPFLAPDRCGAHDPAYLRVPADTPFAELEPILEGWRLTTIAPELPGALELIAWLSDHGVLASVGHTAADLGQARAAYSAGAASTTHLFNAMTGVHHHQPGAAVAALTEDRAFVELIADLHHVDPSLWPIILRTKPPDRLLLVSDGIALGGTDATRGTIGGLAVEVKGDRCTLEASDVLAGSVVALDESVRNLVRAGIPLATALAAASLHPAMLLGDASRGRLEVGCRADLVELDDELDVRRVLRGDAWYEGR